jgi:hypothetical protein
MSWRKFHKDGVPEVGFTPEQPVVWLYFHDNCNQSPEAPTSETSCVSKYFRQWVVFSVQHKIRIMATSAYTLPISVNCRIVGWCVGEYFCHLAFVSAVWKLKAFSISIQTIVFIMDHFVTEGAASSYHILRSRLYHGNECVSSLLCKFCTSRLKQNTTRTAIGSHDYGKRCDAVASLSQKLQTRVAASVTPRLVFILVLLDVSQVELQQIALRLFFSCLRSRMSVHLKTKFLKIRLAEPQSPKSAIRLDPVFSFTYHLLLSLASVLFPPSFITIVDSLRASFFNLSFHVFQPSKFVSVSTLWIFQDLLWQPPVFGRWTGLLFSSEIFA